jgi:hypothetical protein
MFVHVALISLELFECKLGLTTSRYNSYNKLQFQGERDTNA